ncbi:hypothetical protein [Actinospica robiniae]|uniref:hypothetical protein n=1 Tax=Actinospica robiniae TaxID=304901 RepID=UPI00055849EB|nr:hypothetical protein [Actinospica robiniae]
MMVRTNGSGRVLASVLAVVALVIGAFQGWTSFRTGDKLTLHVLTGVDFGATGDIVKTVGGLSILIALVAVVALVDPSGWLTRLAGAAAVIVAVMFAIEAFRYYGHHFDTALHNVRAGFWLELGAGVLLLLAGSFNSRRAVVVPTADENAETLVETRH